MKKILVVDDMEVGREMTAFVLEENGYETVGAGSAKEALEVYRKELPDMIISDFRLQDMTGFDLQIALQSEFHKKIPFIFLTGDQTEETESLGFDNGALDFLHKPFKPEIMLRRIANTLQTVGQIQDLKKTSTTDALTGLFNKAASEEELAKICKRSVGSLMMIDLDSFKLVNDIHGHAMGDKILIAFADILRAAFRSSDLIGRMGGDEFVAFCDGVQEETAISLKTQFINEKITEAAKKLMGEDMNIPLGASIGCVLVPNSGTNFAELYKMADKALYTVKQNGKHGYSIFSEDTPEEEVETVVTLAQIEMILGERNKEPGAYVLPFENFRIVYRFLKRTRGGYGKTICILLFSLKRKGDDEKISLKDASEQFMDCLHETLRRGDVVTKNGRNQFIALLTNTDGHHDVTGAVGRLAESWSNFDAGKNFYFTHEWAVMDNA
ncbi:MAG: diguanylate cyclase [Selenomonadaceae bacterium]|nr:diguanylate cyclase [Selenomonadaceae bacterium]